MRWRVGPKRGPLHAAPTTTWLLWVALLVVATAGMLAVRGRLDKAHVALAYLLIVLGGSAGGGRRLGLALAALAFLAFDYLFLPPYYTLALANPLDGLVLLAFLATSAVAAELLDRARAEAARAEARAVEVERLAAIGAEALNAGAAEDAISAITSVIRSTLGVARCEIFQGDPPPESLVAWVRANGHPAIEQLDGTVSLSGVASWTSAHAVLVPLEAQGRTVGVLRIEDPRGITLDGPWWHFLTALSYYAALGVERTRLEGEAQHAAALREADRLKDALLAGVSHDLRTPLTTIKALAEEMVGGGDERALTIQEEADRLNRMVADLLELSQLQSGSAPVRPELNAVDDLIGAALQRVAGVAAAHPIVAHVENAETAVLVGRFDLAQSLRALVNLLDNAMKYSPSGTPVEVTVRRDGEWLLIDVADRGPGVPVAERDRIFEPFYRPPGTPPDVGGTGLGLSIARRLAEAQGGGVRLAPREGGGSTFTFLLPAADFPAV